MKYLDKFEKKHFLAHLAQWQTPQAMHLVVEDIMNTLGSRNLFNQSGLAFLRDAWIAAEFGEMRKVKHVRLVSENWPDFELLLDHQIEAFEAVEADDPDRRRGDEYQENTGIIEDDPVEEWIFRAEQAPIWMENVCRKKVKKHYSARSNLVIYLNMSEYGIRQSEVESCFQSATEVAKDDFETIWILWKKKTYRIWPRSRATR